MLRIPGPTNTGRNSISRRELLQASGLGALGFGLGQLCELQSLQASAADAPGFGKRSPAF